MVAKYYIYRNLRTKGFSIRHRGKVVSRLEDFYAYNCEFKVNKKGRDRVLKEGQKNVHAFVVCEHYSLYPHSYDRFKDDDTIRNSPDLKEIRYNPYRADHFQNSDGQEIHYVNAVMFGWGKCFEYLHIPK